MKKIIISFSSLAVIGIALGLFWVTASALTKDKLVGLVTSGELDRQCFNYYKDNHFKNPYSAYLGGSRFVDAQNVFSKYKNEEVLAMYRDNVEIELYDSILWVKVFAKNSMGGYVSSEISCPIIDSKIADEFFARHIKELEIEKSMMDYCISSGGTYNRVLNNGTDYLSMGEINKCMKNMVNKVILKK